MFDLFLGECLPGLDPAHEFGMVDVIERSEIRAPLSGSDGDKAVVRACGE